MRGETSSPSSSDCTANQNARPTLWFCFFRESWNGLVAQKNHRTLQRWYHIRRDGMDLGIETIHGLAPLSRAPVRSDRPWPRPFAPASHHLLEQLETTRTRLPADAHLQEPPVRFIITQLLVRLMHASLLLAPNMYTCRSCR